MSTSPIEIVLSRLAPSSCATTAATAGARAVRRTVARTLRHCPLASGTLAPSC